MRVTRVTHSGPKGFYVAYLERLADRTERRQSNAALRRMLVHRLALAVVGVALILVGALMR
jgi:hypothetical protein